MIINLKKVHRVKKDFERGDSFWKKKWKRNNYFLCFEKKRKKGKEIIVFFMF